MNKLVTAAAFASCIIGSAYAQTYDLPIVFVNTQGKKCLDMNVTEKIPATMKVLDGKSNNVADSAKGTEYSIGIKVRGQSSATFPKPGYTIEIRDSTGEGTDVSMFGLPPSDDWIFHGPYVDKSLIRNALAHWLFRQAGRYSPRTKHFDLYINGQYRGVYALIEKIKRDKYRVNVSKLKETDLAGDSLTGGYIWAFDQTGTNTGGAGNNNQGGIDAEGFKTNGGVNVIMHYPKKDKDPKKNKLQKEQENYLKKYLNDLEGLFSNGKNGSGYENYVDLGSAVDYVLHQEAVNNADSYWCSFFLFKPKDKTDKDGKKIPGKVTLGPPWDFNLAMSNGTQPENGGGGGMWGGGGGMFSSGTTGWQIESSSKFGGGGGFGMGFTGPAWLNKLWTSDATYKAEVKRRWAELRSGVWHDKTMDKYLDSMKTYLKNAADRNFKRWPNLGKASGTYDADPEPMKECGGQGGGQQGGGGMGGWGFGGGGGMAMAMGGYNATTWDGEFEHVRKKMKERMKWMDDQLGFTLPANPVVTEPLVADIHNPDWQHDKDTTDEESSQTTPGQTTPGQTTPGQTTPGQTTPGQTTPGQTTPSQTNPGDTSSHHHGWGSTQPPSAISDDFSRLAPMNFFAVNGNHLEIHTTISGTLALIDLNGTILYKTQIKAGITTLKIPSKARDKHWIVTLNGKMMNK